MGEYVYSHRFSLFTSHRTYRLGEDAIAWQDEDGGEGKLAYADVGEVRLSSWPDFQAGVVYATVSPRHGKALKLSNRSYVSLGNFDMQADEFATFLQGLHRKLAAQGDAISYRLGATMAGYVATILYCTALFIFIAGALYAILAEASVLMGAISIVILLSFVPWLVRFLIASRPGSYSPEDLYGP